MANAAHIPAPISAMDMPCFVGGPSGSPVIAIMPLIAWANASYPGRSRYGPTWPKPDMEQ